MDWSIIGVIGTICGIVFGYLGYQKGKKDENTKKGIFEGTLVSDIEYIKKRTDDVFLEQKDTNRNVGILTERIAKNEENTKSAHHRLDTIEAMCNNCRRS